MLIPFANFIARIAHDLVQDDGAENDAGLGSEMELMKRGRQQNSGRTAWVLKLPLARAVMAILTAAPTGPGENDDEMRTEALEARLFAEKRPEKASKK
jgi:hypothetical protein